MEQPTILRFLKKRYFEIYQIIHIFEINQKLRIGRHGLHGMPVVMTGYPIMELQVQTLDTIQHIKEAIVIIKELDTVRTKLILH